MSNQPPLLRHLNKRLFADYFLNERVRQAGHWAYGTQLQQTRQRHLEFAFCHCRESSLVANTPLLKCAYDETGNARANPAATRHLR